MLVTDPYTGQTYDDGQPPPSSNGLAVPGSQVGVAPAPTGSTSLGGGWSTTSPLGAADPSQVAPGTAQSAAIIAAGGAPAGSGILGTPAPDNPPPTSPPPPSGDGGFGPNSGFTFPTFTAPPLPTIAPLQAPAPFSYAPFTAPTADEAAAQPGYQFAVQQGEQALENSAAAKGVLRTGGTLKDILGFGQQAATQNYGNVYAQDLGTYQTNEGVAQNAYNTNWGVTKDTYGANTATTLSLADLNLQSKLDEFNPAFQASSLQFSDAYNRWLAGLNATTSIAVAGAGL